MANTSTIHIKTDFDCIVYDYDQELGTTKAGTYFNIELRKGEHELTFVFIGDESISKTIDYIVKDVDCDYRLIIEIAETICDKAEVHLDLENYSTAFALYSLAAEKGYAKAQCKLGICYYYGYGIEKDLAKAVEWYTKAAEQGDADAQSILGFCYEYGTGVKKDLTKAVEWYTQTAEQGDADAQYYLGNCYEYGTGVEKDLAKAVEWYTKAAEQGDADAQFNLGVCYEHGTGIEKNLTKAVEWYTKAAEQGYAIAQCNLGVCYNNGSGVEQNLAKAVEWYTQATEQGNADAQCNLGVCYELGTGIEKNLTKAVEWYTKAAKQGLARAQCNLGYCYDEGNGVEKDLAKAVEWYAKAAEQGNARAQCNLGYCYEKGNGVEKDLAKAVEWYTKAAVQGNAQAQYNLGVCYEYGTGVEKNLAKAVEWYTKAAKQGNEDAQKALDRLKPNRKNCIEYLFFDTETTGVPQDYNAPTSNSRNWPRLVQLSWITTDDDCNILTESDYIVYPDGFVIPSDAAKLHGITTNIAKDKGRPLEVVLERFSKDFNSANTIVGHNIAFDKKIVGAELIRLGLKDIMNSKKSLCTMESATDYCKIPGSYGYKWPKLQELHKKLFGCEFEDAHNSMSDVKATLKCFKEMRKKGLI